MEIIRTHNISKTFVKTLAFNQISLPGMRFYSAIILWEREVEIFRNLSP